MAKKKASLTDLSKDPMAAMKKARNKNLKPDAGGSAKSKSKNQELKSLNTRLPADLIRQIKLYCAENDVTVQQFMREAVESKLS